MKQLSEMTITEFEVAPLQQRAEYIATSTVHGFGVSDAARYWLQKWQGKYESSEAADNWLDSQASDYPWTERTYNRIRAALPTLTT